MQRAKLEVPEFSVHILHNPEAIAFFRLSVRKTLSRFDDHLLYVRKRLPRSICLQKSPDSLFEQVERNVGDFVSAVSSRRRFIRWRVE